MDVALERGTGISLYAQVQEELLARIDERRWLPGQMIPTEQQLAEEFGVSRNTIRQAVGILVNNGLLARYAGRGTFVVSDKIQDVTFRSGQSVAERYGTRATARVLEVNEYPADSTRIPTSLDVPGDMKVLRVRRVLSVEEPFLLTESYLVVKRDADVPQKEFEKYVIPHIVSKYGAGPIVYTQRTFEAVMSMPDEMDALGIDRPQPLLLVRSVAQISGGQRVTTTRSLFRGDLYRYSTVSVSNAGG